jgi:uncharacterized protein
MSVLFFFVSLAASVVGAISGIGGGVIIKPVLDGISTLSVAAVSFLSSTTVLSMSTVTLIRNRRSPVNLHLRTTGVMAAGGVAGGLLGKYLFDLVRDAYPHERILGILQALILFLITTGVLLFSLKKDSIKPRSGGSIPLSAVIGLILGATASFLGIGGGPINLAVLYYFFSMDTKTAAINSIFIIFFSQLTSLLFTLVSGTLPHFALSTLLLMITGGVGGGLIGSHFSGRMSNRAVDRLFIGVLAAIMLLCIYNTIKWI